MKKGPDSNRQPSAPPNRIFLEDDLDGGCRNVERRLAIVPDDSETNQNNPN
jgi:hypothetical protein